MLSASKLRQYNKVEAAHYDVVQRCRLNPVEARDERVWFQRLKLKYDELLSGFALSFNLRRYNVVGRALMDTLAEALGPRGFTPEVRLAWTEIGWCRLTLSNPR